MEPFKGFTRETTAFFMELSKNNSKQWFDENRQNYESFVKKPASLFVLSMGKLLRQVAPQINAIPKINQSLFRINRDTRFSKDKSPYKTNMGIWFWEGKGKRMECSGFYFHLEGKNLLLGTGIYMFPKNLLLSFREAAVHKKLGPTLRKAVDRVQEKGYLLGGKHYKKSPRGYDPSHKNADLLLHNGLHAGLTVPLPKEFYSEAILDFSFHHFKAMLPLHEWLKASLS